MEQKEKELMQLLVEQVGKKTNLEKSTVISWMCLGYAQHCIKESKEHNSQHGFIVQSTIVLLKHGHATLVVKIFGCQILA